jgi:hypothetical protein
MVFSDNEINGELLFTLGITQETQGFVPCDVLLEKVQTVFYYTDDIRPVL